MVPPRAARPLRLVSPEDAGILAPARLQALADGVFAFAMTLLVLAITVPVVSTATADRDLPGALSGEWERFLVYVASFVVLGVMWTGHHVLHHFVERANRVMQWLNMAVLLPITFVPFAAALFGAYPRSRVAAVVYNCVLLVVPLIYLATLRYVRKAGLHTAGTEDFALRVLRIRFWFAAAGVVVIIGLAFLSPTASAVADLLIPIPFLLPARLDVMLRVADRGT
ncbi:MAG: TMEM175 family protein [Thermoplasmatota archaeon]